MDGDDKDKDKDEVKDKGDAHVVCATREEALNDLLTGLEEHRGHRIVVDLVTGEVAQGRLIQRGLAHPLAALRRGVEILAVTRNTGE